MHQRITSGLQAVAGRNNLHRAGTRPVPSINIGRDDRQAERGTSRLDGGVNLKIRRPEVLGRATAGVLDGVLALLEIIINLRVAPAKHMRVRITMILDAKAGILNGIESRHIAADPVSPDKEGGPGTCIFEVINQRR